MAKLTPRITSFPKGMDRATKKQFTSKRDQEIMELTRAELDECLASGELLQNEYAGEINARTFYEQVNPAQLAFDATYIPHAAVELRRRNGELAR